jgi:hypothetical protein
LSLYRDVIQYVDDRGCHYSSNFSVRGISAAIVGIDFEKPYDLVNREVLWRILDVVGYPSPSSVGYKLCTRYQESQSSTVWRWPV